MIEWLSQLPPYLNVLLSIAITFAGIAGVLIGCTWMFKKMDEAERRERDEA